MIEVRIIENYSKRNLEIWVFADRGYIKGNLQYNKEFDSTEWIEFDPRKATIDIDLKPLLNLPLFGEGSMISHAIAEAILKNGYKPKSEDKIEGQLLATEKHLDDMRQITKHLLKIKEEQK